MGEYDIDEVETHLRLVLTGTALGELEWLVYSLREAWSPRPDSGSPMLDGPEARVRRLEARIERLRRLLAEDDDDV